MKKEKRTTRRFEWEGNFFNPNYRQGVYSVWIGILAVALVIGINLIVNSLPVSMTKIDTTFSALHTLSDDTKELIAGLDEPIEIYLICTTGREDAIVTGMLERYEELSDNLKVSFIDPALHPSFLGQFTSETVLPNNSLIASGKLRSQIINYTDIYSYTTFLGEDYLNSAISYVTAEVLPVIYNLTGHGEQVLSETLINSLTLDGYFIDDFRFITGGSIPDDVAAILVNTPVSDFTEEEAAKIIEYLEAGGRLLLITGYAQKELPNLLFLMENYGVGLTEGYICEGDDRFTLSGMPNYIVPFMSDSNEAESILEGVAYVLLADSQGIHKIDAYRSSIKIDSLLYTSESSFSKVSGSSPYAGRETGDIPGPFVVASAIREQYLEKETRIVWYASGYLLDETMDKLVNGSNTTLFLNSLGWLVYDDAVPSLHSKTTTLNSLTISTYDERFWTVVMVGVIPLVFLLFGLVNWLRRKRR